MAATSSARAGRRMGIFRTIRFRRSGECSRQRSIEVQEVVESCCKSIGGKFLFIGTGQTAVTGTANLGEVSRHLANISIGHRQGDIPHFAQDYPIATLQLNLPGAGAQLRSSSMKRICEKLFSFSLCFRSV